MDLKTSRSLGMAAASAVMLALSSQSHATIIVQELFDNIGGGGDKSLNGLGDTATTVGLTGTWQVNGTNGMMIATNFNGGTSASPALPGLPPGDGALGGVWNGTGSYNTNIYATRPLTSTIDFGADQVLYFSVRLDNPLDTAMGIGLASGTSASGSTSFIGAGLSWNNATSIGGSANDASNASYISYGTLGADNGPYGIRAHEAKDSVNGAALIVGRITISSTVADQIDIMRYGPGSTIQADPSLVTAWTASDSFDTSMVADNLLLWLNGGSSGGGQVDAIRIGTTWADVTGVPEPGSVALAALAAGFGFVRRRR
ncbi:PEP-CTERM sorting domain-containing protein [Luteolibacter flavescens]|uniref:PEP-CTERM sorting domain-containing protein n=1 Tax=Luteolibacter flavescens TaxID=1859460 RepID=A0ABT3FRY5_9BACT|nr:PEP-CTERM sorting domain-containing protein [Luteolibacter flavescens]MCW1886346.1 PEP-CTERM sorting domain-containing protein [Luteolibacter flavescens]